MKPYLAVFNRPALEFVANADDLVFAEIESWVNFIERAPHTSGDYTETDASRRDVQVVVLRHVAIAYWADHAVRELRVVRIEVS